MKFQPIHGVLLSLFLLCAVVIMTVSFMYVSANNKEISLRNQFVAQQELNKATFDNVWKIIQQQTQVTTKERESFKETFVEIMNAQQGIAGDGSLASFFTQSKVDVTPDLFSKLMTTIESQRMSFLESQKKLLQIKKDHDDLLQQIPSSLFLGGRDELKAIIVTSSKTNETFESGNEDNVNLFE